MGVWIGYSMVWLSCAAVAVAGVYLTRSPYTLWVMVLPLFVSVSKGGKNPEADE